MEVFKVFCARRDQDHAHQWKNLAFSLAYSKKFLVQKIRKNVPKLN